MSKRSYIRDLSLRLAAVDCAIEDARRTLACAEDHEKVEAASELTELRRERRRLADRQAWLLALPDGRWPEIKAAVREQFNDLLSAFDPHHTEVQPYRLGRVPLRRLQVPGTSLQQQERRGEAGRHGGASPSS